MSYDDFSDDTSRGQAAKPGMSTGVKVLIGVLVGGGLIMLLCCGGVFFFGWSVAKQAELKTDPPEVQKIAEGIAKVELPADYAPQAGLNMEVLGVGIAIATYADGESGIVLMSAKFPQQAGAPEQRDLQINQQFQQGQDMYIAQSQGKYFTPESLKNTESEARELTVKGQPTEFQFTKGTGTVSGTELRQVEGTFADGDRSVRIIVQVPEDKYNEEEIVKMIESIQ